MPHPRCDFAGHSTCAQPLPPPYCFSSCLPIPLEALPYQIHVHKPWAQDLFLKTIPKQFSKEAEKREAGVGVQDMLSLPQAEQLCQNPSYLMGLPVESALKVCTD